MSSGAFARSALLNGFREHFRMTSELNSRAANVADEVALSILDIPSLDRVKKETVLGIDYPHALRT